MTELEYIVRIGGEPDSENSDNAGGGQTGCGDRGHPEAFGKVNRNANEATDGEEYRNGGELEIQRKNKERQDHQECATPAQAHSGNRQ